MADILQFPIKELAKEFIYDELTSDKLHLINYTELLEMADRMIAYFPRDNAGGPMTFFSKDHLIDLILWTYNFPKIQFRLTSELRHCSNGI